MSELDKVLSEIPTQIFAYTEISALARADKYPQALEKLKASTLNDSTKKHLQEVLDTRDPYLVRRSLDEIEMRIAQAMCWDCWKD